MREFKILEKIMKKSIRDTSSRPKKSPSHQVAVGLLFGYLFLVYW